MSDDIRELREAVAKLAQHVRRLSRWARDEAVANHSFFDASDWREMSDQAADIATQFSEPKEQP